MNTDIHSYRVPMVAETAETERAAFIRKTYWHLAGAIGLFAILEALFIKLGFGEKAMAILGTSSYSWLIVLGCFHGRFIYSE